MSGRLLLEFAFVPELPFGDEVWPWPPPGVFWAWAPTTRTKDAKSAVRRFIFSEFIEFPPAKVSPRLEEAESV